MPLVFKKEFFYLRDSRQRIPRPSPRLPQTMRHFLVDFFFGPCLDISAVNPRQDQEASNHSRHRSHNRNNHQEREQQSKPRSGNSDRSLHDNNGSTKKNRRKSKSNAASSLDLVRLHTPTRNSPRGGKSETTTRRRRLGGGILAKYNNGGAASKYKHLSSRSDDASVMTASLVETYRAYSTEITDSEIGNTTSEEYLEEQSVIRRSLKDHAGNHRGENMKKKKKKKEKEVAPRLKSIAEYNEHDDENAAITSAQQQSQQFSASTNKSELANWIEQTTTTPQQCTASTNIEYDNVTTISQASKNPYTVLGVSQHSSSRVIDSSYQAKIKVATVQQQQQHQIQQRGGQYQGDEGENKYSISEKAIADVTNAYRRIKADIQRQEQEEILRQEQQNRRSSQRKNTNSNDSSRQRQRNTTFTDSNQKRVNGNSSCSSQKNTHHIKYNNNHTDDIDDDEDEVEEEDDNSSSSAKTRISKRLKDHRELVHDLFAKHNKRSSKNNVAGTNSSSDGDGVGGGDGHRTTNSITTLQQSITNQTKAMAEMKLVPIEAGANNINEQKQTIQNNCFYLSLAASYLSGVGAFDNVHESTITTTATTATTSVRDNTTTTANNHITTDNGVDHGSSSDSTIAVLEKRQKVITMNLALQLKRAIESAVLLVHPDWAKSGMVGEEVQAFSDFLVYALDSNSVLGHWAIAVFDEASGFVDVYRGRHYGKIYPPTKKRIPSSNNNSNSSSSSSAARVRWSYKDCNETIKRGNTLTLRYIPGHYQPLLPEMVTNKVKFDKQALSSSIEMNNTASHIGDHLRSNRPTLEDILSTLDKWNVLHCVTDGRA